MKHFFMALALLSCSQAAVAQDEFIPNGVITSITASPANGGFNPSFAGVKLEGTIKAGGNSCEAQRYEVGIQMVKKAGKIVFTPFIKEKEGADDIMCIALYDMDFAGLPFKQTFVENRKKLDKALVKDVASLGTLVTLESLYAKEESEIEVPETPETSTPSDCSNINRFCIKNFDPHTCQQVVTKADGSEEITHSRGNNECEARLNLEVNVCQKNSALDESKIICQRDGELF